MKAWFNVLVLGGAALAACGDNDPEGRQGSTANGATTGNGATNGPSTTATTGNATNGSGGATGAGGESGAGAGLQCSPVPSPGDPCGCPCCWVVDCLNTEECCAAFCGDCCG